MADWTCAWNATRDGRLWVDVAGAAPRRSYCVGGGQGGIEKFGDHRTVAIFTQAFRYRANVRGPQPAVTIAAARARIGPVTRGS